MCVLNESEVVEIDEPIEPTIEWPFSITQRKRGGFDATLRDLDITAHACKTLRQAQADLAAILIFELAKQAEMTGSIPVPPARTDEYPHTVRILESDVATSIVLSVDDGDDAAMAFISTVKTMAAADRRKNMFY